MPIMDMNISIKISLGGAMKMGSNYKLLHLTHRNKMVLLRWNRTVVELGHAMIFAHNLSSELWTNAMKHATYIQNCVFT